MTNIIKKYLPFWATITLLLGLFLSGAVYLLLTVKQARASTQAYGEAEQALQSALALVPAPTEANWQASEAHIKALQITLKAQIEATEGRNLDILNQRPPLSSTDMYYELLAYQNELEKDARGIRPINSTELGVGIPKGFAWGFSRYLANKAGTPPPEAAIEQIFRQKVILNDLLRKLLATGPQCILSVKREPIVLEKQPWDGDGAKTIPLSNENAGSEVMPAPWFQGCKPERSGILKRNEYKPEAALASDEFWMGPESVALEGVVETLGFAISFTGYTQNLRAFLKSITAFELPVIVRRVEVQPWQRKPRQTTPESEGLFAVFEAMEGNDQTLEAQKAMIEKPRTGGSAKPVSILHRDGSYPGDCIPSFK